jgi:hypothetical protein
LKQWISLFVYKVVKEVNFVNDVPLSVQLMLSPTGIEQELGELLGIEVTRDTTTRAKKAMAENLYDDAAYTLYLSHPELQRGIDTLAEYMSVSIGWKFEKEGDETRFMEF